MENTQTIKLAIFASGAGSNTREIINFFKSSHLVEVVLIAGNNLKSGVATIAKDEGLPFLWFDKKRFYDDGYVTDIGSYNLDLIILAGFMWKIPLTILNKYPGKIINIHPALLPKYGGKGMFGMHVHKAVIEAKEKESGITIHYVDEFYDHGNIIFQKRCIVEPSDTPETLANKIHELEHEHYPVVIQEEITKAESKARRSSWVSI